jgi:competence protein ComEA
MLRSFTRTLAAVTAAFVLAGLPLAQAETGPLDVNTATAEQLTTLKGVGPAKARAIVEHRDKNGQFKSVDDLKLVQGIGDKMLEQLRPQVTVQGGAPAAAAAHP